MRFDEVCYLLERLEQDNDVNSIEINGIELWPLIRYCIWVELIQPAQQTTTIKKHFGQSFISRLQRAINLVGNRATDIDECVTSIFISQWSNLQLLPDSQMWFDRILDPLIFIASHHERVEKFYLSPLPPAYKLFRPAHYFHHLLKGSVPDCQPLLPRILELFQQAGVEPDRSQQFFTRAWRSFFKWYYLGKKIFSHSPSLRRLYLASWYFPENMGLIAAARELGITSVDVQHGKQGRFQAMYTWWTSVPENGYAMVPDWFWCWGAPSCQHILAHSPDRSRHRPFVGGFPWVDYYKNYISRLQGDPQRLKTNRIRILFTLQGQSGDHVKPIPDFVLDYLNSDVAQDAYFIFRNHPNFTSGMAYCERRLKGVSVDRYRIDEGKSNLYDELQLATHHITAFSSCCYEAQMFGVPTLLFGTEARNIYAQEIDSKIFDWITDDADSLANWLMNSDIIQNKITQPYIETSLRLAVEQIFLLRMDQLSAHRLPLMLKG